VLLGYLAVTYLQAQMMEVVISTMEEWELLIYRNLDLTNTANDFRP